MPEIPDGAMLSISEAEAICSIFVQFRTVPPQDYTFKHVLEAYRLGVKHGSCRPSSNIDSLIKKEKIREEKNNIREEPAGVLRGCFLNSLPEREERGNPDELPEGARESEPEKQEISEFAQMAQEFISDMGAPTCTNDPKTIQPEASGEVLEASEGSALTEKQENDWKMARNAFQQHNPGAGAEFLSRWAKIGYSPAWIIDAVGEAARCGKGNRPAYIDGILKRYARDGKSSREEEADNMNKLLGIKA